ncbi:MAG: HEAT repeat domain-containing protein [Gemmataceae bacterium]|nr:HEAT repeat domain-containing protein [Gemmataceae bacterium]
MKLYVAACSISMIAFISFVEAQAPKREDVPKYLKALQSSQNAKDRAVAASMLGKRGAINVKDVEEAIEPLKKTLEKDVDASVRKAAATAIGSIAPKPDETIPLLIESLKKDKSSDVKLAIVETLGRYGADAKPALPAIRDYAKDFDKKSKEAQLVRTATMAISGKKK